MVLALSGIACIGLLISTRTDSGPGAAVATIVIAIASQILGQIPSLDAIHPYLPTYGWLGFTGLFRFPVDWDQMRGGLLVSAVYSRARAWGSRCGASGGATSPADPAPVRVPRAEVATEMFPMLGQLWLRR